MHEADSMPDQKNNYHLDRSIEWTQTLKKLDNINENFKYAQTLQRFDPSKRHHIDESQFTKL